MENTLKQILADSAFNNDMQVDPAVARLAKAVKYLSTQLSIVAKNPADLELQQENTDYVAKVLKNTKEILSGK